MSARPVLVVGATAGTGVHVVRALLSAGSAVRVAARNPQKARALFGDAVEIVHLDLDQPGSDVEIAVRDVDHVVVTAAVPPGFAGEAQLRRTEQRGLRALAEAAVRADHRGRFVYLTTLGVHVGSPMVWALDCAKWNLRQVRRDTEAELQTLPLDLCFIRAGMLSDGVAGTRPLRLWKGDAHLRLNGWVARADVARLIVDSLSAPGLAEVSVEWAPVGVEEPALAAIG